MREDEFRGHALWTAVGNVTRRLDETEPPGDAQQAELRDRLRFLASNLLSYAETDPALFASSLLEPVRQAWENAANHMASSPSVQALSNAVNYAESAMPTVGAWPQALAKGGAAVRAARIFEEYRELAMEANERLRNALTAQEAAFTDATRGHAAREAELEAEIEALRVEAAALRERIAADEGRLEQTLLSINETYRESQNDRDKRFGAWLEEQGTELEELAQPLLSRLSEAKEAGDERLTELNSLYERVENLAGKATGAVLARGYGTYSTREWASGVLSYVLGFAVLAAVGIFLLVVVGRIAVDDEVSWQFVALRLGVTFTGLGASAVAFQLGSKFLTRAATNKRVELELRAIGTFLEDVDDKEAVKKAKLDFVGRMFGRAHEQDQITSGADDRLSPEAFTGVLDAVARLQGKS